MQGSYAVGRLFGIQVRVTPSWFVAVFGSIAFLGLKVFPELLPNTAKGTHWALAVATSLLFFGSVLLHELAHALLARHFGVPVRGITLFLLGGAAHIGQELRRPYCEALIAAAGPLVSLTLGAAFFFPVVFSHHRGPAALMLVWVGLMNLSVGIFNLLPGFPMDGGRIFRALMWALTGRYGLATRIGAWSGRLLALTMIGLGMVMIAGFPPNSRLADPFGGLWLVLLGLYLDYAARQSLVAVRVLEVLCRYRVADLMVRDVPVVAVGDPVLEFLPALLSLRDCEAAFVAEQLREIGEGRPEMPRMVGMVLRGRAVRVPERDWSRTTASELMLPAVGIEPAAPEDDAASLLQRLELEGLAALPVVAAGEVVGLIGRAGLLRLVEGRGRV